MCLDSVENAEPRRCNDISPTDENAFRIECTAGGTCVDYVQGWSNIVLVDRLWDPEDYLVQSDEYVTPHTRVTSFGTYLEDDQTSYIVTLLGMTVQEQDGVAAVLDFVNKSYNGNVDRHKALQCTAREGEKHACQMFRLDLIQTEQPSKRACTSLARL